MSLHATFTRMVPGGICFQSLKSPNDLGKQAETPDLEEGTVLVVVREEKDRVLVECGVGTFWVPRNVVCLGRY